MATTQNRSVKSIKDELIKKSREAIMDAVQIYHNPQITFQVRDVHYAFNYCALSI